MNAVQKPRVTLSEFKATMAEAIDSGELKQVDPPLEHYHTPDLYGRRIFVDADTAIVTKVHKSEHITIALKGSCTVVDENGVKTEVVAPAVFITKPGTWRAVYAHTDVEWVTVHACKEQELAAIEAQLVCDTPEEVDQEDYKRVLLEYNMNEKMARLISENPRTQIDAPADVAKIRISPSKIQGDGVFANGDIAAGEKIGVARIGPMRTLIGRYTNHSVNPNCEFRPSTKGGMDAYALRDIGADQEITVCYRLARKASIAAAQFLEKAL
jgi:quercetin dioxygenase-like cupin family protein